MEYREIKFRQPIFVNGVFSRWHYWGFIGEGMFNGPLDNDAPSHQFTGLHDENGKEIYEKDICQAWGGEYSQGYWEYDIKGIVEFSNGAFYIKYNGVCYDFRNFDKDKIKTIGNIHENPELLK